MPKRSRSGAEQQPRPRRRADERERRQRQAHRARRRALADDEVEGEVLHRRVEDLRHRGREAVDLVHEQHAVRLQVGEDRGEVAGALEHRAGGDRSAHAHLRRDDVGEGGLAEAGRPEQQHVVERLGARAGGGDEHAEVGGDLLLADVLGEGARAQALLEPGLGGIAGRGQDVLVHPPMLPRPAVAERRAWLRTGCGRQCGRRSRARGNPDCCRRRRKGGPASRG